MTRSPDQRRDVIAVEEELALRLAGVAAMRSAELDRIQQLAARMNSDALVSLLEAQRLLALIGSRLIETCNGDVEAGLRSAVESAMADARRRHTLATYYIRDFSARLDGAGIAAVSLKGPLLAERLYADPGLRAAPHDLDFLVHRQRLNDAVQLFRDLGYTIFDDSIWADGLPHYHYGLRPPNPPLPQVELHWRIHWYEKEFADRLIEASSQDGSGVRIPSPAYDLATLLIIFARDGFVGLRIAADIGAWWDAYGGQLAPLGLDPIMVEYPRLRPAMIAALDAAQQLVGLPRDELVSIHWRASNWRTPATRLTNWRSRGTQDEVATRITLVDLLLCPPAAARVYIRHYYFQPLSNYISDYGWKPEARLRNELRRAIHALARIAKSIYKYSRQLWAIRGGTSFDALPARSAPHRDT